MRLCRSLKKEGCSSPYLIENGSLSKDYESNNLIAKSTEYSARTLARPQFTASRRQYYARRELVLVLENEDMEASGLPGRQVIPADQWLCIITNDYLYFLFDLRYQEKKPNYEKSE
jgi:hypothetical protein